MRKTAAILAVLAAFAGFSIAQAEWRDYFTWEATVWMDDGTEKAKVGIGTSKSATDGYDALYESDAYPSGSLRPYFYHPEWGRSAVSGGTDYYWTDIRSTALPQTWEFHVQGGRTGTNVKLSWDVTRIEPGQCVALSIVDSATGVETRMRESPSYTYYNSSTSPRKFTVVASEGGC